MVVQENKLSNEATLNKMAVQKDFLKLFGT